ncbi:uncharacterized protein LOC131220196 [Magnolia sinica]|uniref:uncharacterized protein LOC131220196 n=1 Tax=Magnolia sinica TaxID=86752 RepID=UPI002659266A|nr:uncharacterized protein LOC131220196 [Magnolia sinica]
MLDVTHSPHSSILDRLLWWWGLPCPRTYSSSTFHLASTFLLSEIWKVRNKSRFDGHKISIQRVFRRASWWLLNKHARHKPPQPSPSIPAVPGSRFSFPTTCLDVVRWQKPPADWCKLNVDGSTIQNLGSVRGGGIYRDHNSTMILAFYNGYDVTSNNRAEIRALHDGLELCVLHRLQNVHIESDSGWVVDCILGKSTVEWKWK